MRKINWCEILDGIAWTYYPDDKSIEGHDTAMKQNWVNEKITDKMKEYFEKHDVFVEHIEKHLEEMKIPGKVMCKICGKDIDEIYEEEKP